MRSVRPSLIIQAYLILTVPLDFTEVRTLWLRYSVPKAVVQTIIASTKSLLLIAEAREKKGLLRGPGVPLAPEAFIGLFSRSTFWWLNPLFVFGYRNRLSESDDTLLSIDDALLTETPVHKGFEQRWNRGEKIKLLL